MRYHFTPVRMVIIKKSTNNKCWRRCGEKGMLLHCWWECKLIQPLWKMVWRFLKKTRNKMTIWPRNPTPSHNTLRKPGLKKTHVSPHAKSWLIGKDSDAGRDWGQEEKGKTEDEMAGWHHWLWHEFGWTLGVGDGQGGLVCCNSWGRKESDTTERLNWTELIPLFTEALFTIARTWKQPRCPSTDEWIKLWYIYTMEYYSAIKRNTFESVLMRWMNLEPIIQSEVSQKEKDKYRILTRIYGI